MNRNIADADGAVVADQARKQEFLNNFRVARNLFFHRRVDANGPQIDRQALEGRIARAAIWLTPKSVKDFNPADFSELGPDRQKELQGAVRDFREWASQVPANKPASSEQHGNAAIAFTKILEILKPYLHTPEEGTLVENVLREVDFPPWVVTWDYEFGSDEEGSPAVWINIYADENAASPREFGRLASRLTQRIRQPLASAGVQRWPYIRVRTAVEHKSM
jgi:hypothetical protein